MSYLTSLITAVRTRAAREKRYLCDGVVDVDGWNFQLALLHHLVQIVDACSRFLR